LIPAESRPIAVAKNALRHYSVLMVQTTGTTRDMQERQLDPKIERRLFAVATKAFVKDGFERASLNAILAEVGLGKSSFFYYFLDKEDLFATVMATAVARVAKAAGPTSLPNEPDRFWREAADLFRRWGDAADAELGFLGLLRAYQPLRHVASPRLHSVMDEARQTFRALLCRGVELQVVRKDMSVDGLMTLIEAVDLALDDEFHRASSHDSKEIEAHRHRFFDLIARIIRP